MKSFQATGRGGVDLLFDQHTLLIRPLQFLFVGRYQIKENFYTHRLHERAKNRVRAEIRRISQDSVTNASDSTKLRHNLRMKVDGCSSGKLRIKKISLHYSVLYCN